MKTFISTIAIAMIAAGSAMAGAPTTPSAGLKTLATTGWADDYANANGGVAYDKTGGGHEMFTYDVATPWQFTAMSYLNPGEFLAPHFAVVDGDVVIMVAPHLVGSMGVVKGAGNPDSFIVVRADGSSDRFDYSDLNG